MERDKIHPGRGDGLSDSRIPPGPGIVESAEPDYLVTRYSADRTLAAGNAGSNRASQGGLDVLPQGLIGTVRVLRPHGPDMRAAIMPARRGYPRSHVRPA